MAAQEFDRILVALIYFDGVRVAGWCLITHYPGADFGGPSAPPSKIFCIYITATMNNMKISFNDVKILNLKNYVHNYIIGVDSVTQWHAPLCSLNPQSEP